MAEVHVNPIRSIVHVNEKAGQFGGTEEYISSLAQSMHGRGVQSYLIYGELYGGLPAGLSGSCQIPELARRDRVKCDFTQLRRTITYYSPDVVYVHNVFSSDAIRAIWSEPRRYVVLWYVHDHFPTCLTELRARTVEPVVCDRLLSDRCLDEIRAQRCRKRFSDAEYGCADVDSRLSLLRSTCQVDAVVVVSDYMREVLIANHRECEARIAVLPRQVRSKGHDLVERSSQGTLKVLFSGRIAREKGLHIAIQALSLARIEEAVRFYIAGVIEDQHYWSDCRCLIERMQKTTGVSAEYRGFLSHDEIDELYSIGDIVLVPSWWGEPSGTVAAEGMANGCAVIASRVGGIPMWVIHEETGLLVPPNDSISLARAIEQLAADESLRRRLARTGKDLICTRFTEAEHLNELTRLISRLRG